MPKEIRINLSDEEHKELRRKKEGRTWLEVLRDGAKMKPSQDSDRKFAEG